ncbi:MAG: hypothetical protein LBO71_05500 [Prevotellaceae bacterium]|nr:hypothetical protein [Prevotellaceae bacterium]
MSGFFMAVNIIYSLIAIFGVEKPNISAKLAAHFCCAFLREKAIAKRKPDALARKIIWRANS